MKPEECIMIMQAKDEAQFMLEKVLEHNSCFFECFVALVDQSSDETYQILRKHPKCAMVVEKVMGDGWDQTRNYAMLCQMADSYDYPWMLRLDADELISHSLLDEMEYLPQEHTVLFNYISLYPDENSFITGNHPYSTLTVQPKIYPKGRVCFPRPFDMSPEIFQHRYTFADSLLYHFHMVDKARRLRRYKTYLRDDPEKIRGGPERPYEKKVKKYQHIVDIEEARHLPISLQKVKTTSQLIDHLESMDELRLIEEKDVENLVSTLKQRVGMVHLKDRFYLPSI